MELRNSTLKDWPPHRGQTKLNFRRNGSTWTRSRHLVNWRIRSTAPGGSRHSSIGVRRRRRTARFGRVGDNLSKAQSAGAVNAVLEIRKKTPFNIFRSNSRLKGVLQDTPKPEIVEAVVRKNPVSAYRANVPATVAPKRTTHNTTVSVVGSERIRLIPAVIIVL